MQREFDAYAHSYAEGVKDPVKSHFASSSEFFAARKLLLIRDFFRRRLQDTRALSWIDVGCGQGELLRLGRSYFAAVAGCDPSDGMIKECVDLNVRQQCSDVIPFSDESFDLATAVCVYHHVDLAARGALTREVMRVLKPGGILCVIEHNPFNPITQMIVQRCPIDVNARLLTARETMRLASASGAGVLETRYFLYFPERLHRLLAGVEDRLGSIPLGGQFAVFSRKPELQISGMLSSH
jgi:SAM-dependent methyltransferase